MASLAGPTNERDRASQAAFAEAVKGLNFETGTVIVESPPRSPDLELAKELRETGEREMKANHRTRAIRALAAAVRADPNDPDSYFLLGQAMVHKGKIEHAEACFRTTIDLAPNRSDAHARLAETLARAGRFPEAIADMNDALRHDPALEGAHGRIAIWYYYLEAYDLAWTHAHRAIAAGSPPPPQFLRLLADRMPDPAKSIDAQRD